MDSPQQRTDIPGANSRLHGHLLEYPPPLLPLLLLSTSFYFQSIFPLKFPHLLIPIYDFSAPEEVSDRLLFESKYIYLQHSFLGCGFFVLLHLDVLGVLSKFPSIRFGIYVCNICKILVIGFFSSIKLFHPSGMESSSSFSHFKHALTFLASSFTVTISTTYQPCLSACPWQPPPVQTRSVSWLQYRRGPRSS